MSNQQSDRFGLINEASKPAAGSKEPPVSPAKFWIQSLDKSEISVSAQFNPKELQIDREVPWSPPGEAGKDNSKSKGATDLEFTGAKGRTLTVELLFDAFEDKASPGFKLEDLPTRVKNLEELASVLVPGDKTEDKRRPHKCVATWGAALARFECVITSISTKYTMFDRAGAPLRATVTLKLQEAGNVSVQKAAAAGATPTSAPKK